jgi:hypothetical protein
MCSPITMHPDAVGGLADEMAALATELHAEADLCRSTAASLHAALDGTEGWVAGGTGTAWASLVQVLADRTSAVALTLVAAVTAYQAEDDAIAGQMTGPGSGRRGPR